MPKVRLAGTVRGERDPNREIRARLLYSLFSRGWDIYNSNGDQRITLCNIERKIVESDAFVFTPGATLEDLPNTVLSAHRAGNIPEIWTGMGEMVVDDLELVLKGLPPQRCQRAVLETVTRLRSKPVGQEDK